MKQFLWLLVLLLPAGASAQPLKLESLDKLAAKASESVNVNLDASLLRLASKFLSAGDSDEAQVKKLVTGLKGVYVRSFEFDKPGQYQDSDLQAIRTQLREAKWKAIVEVRSKNAGDNADVYVRQDGDTFSGLAVIAAEPRELTVVSIDGPIDIDGLVKLSGNFGIPESIRHKVEKKK